MAVVQAPEIFDHDEYDSKADIWSVGCIFYEMLVGETPYRGNGHAALHQDHLTRKLTLPQDVIVTRDSVAILRQVCLHPA
jgi:serine/threonine-protein kinase ULK/ATG1